MSQSLFHWHAVVEIRTLTLLVRPLGSRHHRRHVARQDGYALLALDLAKVLLVHRIDILERLCLGRQELKGRALERVVGGDGVVCRAELSRTERIALGRLLGEVALEVPPHEPQKGRRAALAAKIGAHDEVEEVARREEVQLGDLGRILREHEDEVDGVGAGNRGLHDLVDGARLLLILGGALEDRLEARRVLQLLVGVRVLVRLQRGDRVVRPQLGAHLGEEIERRVHAADVDQQTHHGHVDGGRALRQQLVLEDLAALAALGHGVEVDVGKRVRRPGLRLRLLGEDGLVVLEDELEEVVLDVLAPQRDAVVLLEVLDLVAAVHRRHAAVRVAARRRRRRRVVGARAVAVARVLGALGRISEVAIVGCGRVGQRGRRASVVHGGFGGEDVRQRVPRVGRLCVHGHCDGAWGVRGARCAAYDHGVSEAEAEAGVADGLLFTVSARTSFDGAASGRRG
jgi:hypothetical protein